MRSRVAADLSTRTLRPLTMLVPLNRTGVTLIRRGVASAMAVVGPPLPGATFEPVRRPASSPEAATPRGEWVRARNVAPGSQHDPAQDAVLLYLHGSGYVFCSSRTHRGITTRLSAMTRLPVFSVDYRLAPRHQFPAAAHDVRAAYDLLLREGHDPSRIVVVGDSAGGHLAVDLVLELLHEGQRPPAAVTMFSPVLDLTMGLAAHREATVGKDPMTSARRAASLVDLYAQGQAAELPRLVLDLAQVEDFPPTLIQAGGREMLAADAIELDRLLAEGGARSELEIWPDQMHVFQCAPLLMPEAVRALRRASSFLLAELQAVAGAAEHSDWAGTA